MTYQTAYRAGYRGHRHRHRRRNSHYGVLAALLLVALLAIAAVFFVIKLIFGALFSGGETLVWQIDNTNACLNGKVVALGDDAPFRDANGAVFVPVQALSDQMGLELVWEDTTKTMTLTGGHNTLRAQVDSKEAQINGENRTLSAAPVMKEGSAFVPATDICNAFFWQANDLGVENGDLLIMAQSDRSLSEDKIAKLAGDALEQLGPSENQLSASSVLLRADSDKLFYGGEVHAMKGAGDKRSVPAVEQDGLLYVPLDGAVTAVGGTAAFNGKDEWTVDVNGTQSTVRDDGKTHVGGDRVKGGDIKAFKDADSGKFYVSAPLFAALLGKTCTDLDDTTMALADMSLDGFDSQKAFLSAQTAGLTQAVGADVPEADVYIALTFDDGPTGALDGYPNGLTATLLDGLKERGAHATFFMVGNRVNMFSGAMQRLAAEGHELGNHTMTHPMQHLTGLSADGIRQEISSATSTIQEKAGQAPTVLRPVGGGVNADVKAVAKELGLPIINWNVDTQDWKNRNAQSVHDAIVGAKDGSVVLMHDLYPTSVQGALSAIDDLQKQTDKTYAFVTVSELAAVKGITLEPGVVYNGLTDDVAKQIEAGTYKPTEFT